ncbi:MAG: hypothetical protein M5T61_21155 [Acidimicrobiia bacterium]|nr:hypothetical protein [Acidimicrobiia bacterium]
MTQQERSRRSRSFAARLSSRGDGADGDSWPSDWAVEDRIAERLTDEGFRAEEFPGIVFRTGPTERRGGLAAGARCVWEIVRALKGAVAQSPANPIEVIAEATGLPRNRLELAASYYAAYPGEIDDRIRPDEEAAERAGSGRSG